MLQVVYDDGVHNEPCPTKAPSLVRQTGTTFVEKVRRVAEPVANGAGASSQADATDSGAATGDAAGAADASAGATGAVAAAGAGAGAGAGAAAGAAPGAGDGDDSAKSVLPGPQHKHTRQLDVATFDFDGSGFTLNAALVTHPVFGVLEGTAEDDDEEDEDGGEEAGDGGQPPAAGAEPSTTDAGDDA